jgi:hypothetical protein
MLPSAELAKSKINDDHHVGAQGIIANTIALGRWVRTMALMRPRRRATEAERRFAMLATSHTPAMA